MDPSIASTFPFPFPFSLLGAETVRFKAEINVDGREITRMYLSKMDLEALFKVSYRQLWYSVCVCVYMCEWVGECVYMCDPCYFGQSFINAGSSSLYSNDLPKCNAYIHTYACVYWGYIRIHNDPPKCNMYCTYVCVCTGAMRLCFPASALASHVPVCGFSNDSV